MNASCEHFKEYFKEFGPNAFNVIHGIFSACVSQEARRQKVCPHLTELFILLRVTGTLWKKLKRYLSPQNSNSKQMIFFPVIFF